MSSSHDDPSCDVAHGAAPVPVMTGRVLVAVFASPVASLLLRYGRDAGYRPVLVEPDAEQAKAVLAGNGLGEDGLDAAVEDVVRSYPDGPADVVVTDHHRPELGSVVPGGHATSGPSGGVT